jgi:hypothetical protein
VTAHGVRDQRRPERGGEEVRAVTALGVRDQRRPERGGEEVRTTRLNVDSAQIKAGRAEVECARLAT